MLFDTSSHVGRDRLADLGLDVPTIHNVLAVGAAEQATYTSFDAPGASEMARWSRHIRRLSELLVPQGWARRDPLNQPTLVHPAARHCLLVTSGSVWTGTDLGVPATKNPKGRSIREAVEKNSELALLSVGELDPVLEGLRETWVLLTHADAEGVLRAEVSLPSQMEGDQITRWQHRILIPPLDPSTLDDRRDDENPPSYEFAVVRK